MSLGFDPLLGADNIEQHINHPGGELRPYLIHMINKPTTT
jgi:hypothetical protein